VTVCVTDVVPDGQAYCYGDPCDQVHADIDSALEAAQALPDDDGERPSVRICMGAELPDSGSDYIDSPVIDNRGSVYGEPLELILLRPMCPEPTSGPSQPLLEIVTDGSVRVFGPISTMSGCDAGPRPGVAFWGGGALTLVGLHLDGWTGYGVSNGTVGAAGTLDIARGTVINGAGVAISARDYLNLDGVEIAGNRTDGADALVWTSGSMGILDSVFYGNLVDGSSQALLVGEAVSAHNTAFVANGVLGGRALVVSSLSDGEFLDAGDPDPMATRNGFQNVVFSRTAWIESDAGVDVEVSPGVFPGLGESTAPDMALGVAPT